MLTGLKSIILTVFKPNTKSFLAKMEEKRKKKTNKNIKLETWKESR